MFRKRLRLACLGLALLAVGCQSYQPQSLDLDAHRQAWSSRDPAGKEVTAYARHLRQLNADDAVNFDPSDGFSLDEAELVALVFNPQLRAERLRANVPAVGAPEAGRLDDPELDFDLLRIFDSVSEPWIVGASVSFTIPLSSRLDVEKDMAYSEADVARRQAHQAEWLLKADLKRAWVEWSETIEHVTLVESYLAELGEIIELARKEQQASRIGKPDLRILELEQITRQGELNSLRIERDQQLLVIKAMMGLTPEAEIDLKPALLITLAENDSATRRDQMRENNLRLKIAQAEYQLADHAYQLEIQKQYPDLVIGPGYEYEEGMSRGGVVLSVPIPILNQNKRAIAQTKAARDAAKATYEAEYETLVSELVQAETSVRAARDRSGYLKDNVAPLVDQQMQDLRRLAALGDLNVLVIQDALTRTLDTKVQVLKAQLNEALAVIKLRTLLRPSVTPTAANQQNEIQQ